MKIRTRMAVAIPGSPMITHFLDLAAVVVVVAVVVVLGIFHRAT